MAIPTDTSNSSMPFQQLTHVLASNTGHQLCRPENRTLLHTLLFFLMGSIGLILLSCFFCDAASGQQAQGYRSMEIDERYLLKSTSPQLKQDRSGPRFEELSESQIKKINSDNRPVKVAISEDSKKIDSILENSGDINDPLVKKFFEGYVFAEMTQLTPENISNLGNMRNGFFKDYLSRKVTGQVRIQFIDEIVIPSMRSIYSNAEFHPAARLNAVYIVGMLDSQAANRNGDKMTIPSVTAFDELVAIFDAEQSPAFLKVAALAGLQRHVELDNIVGGQIEPQKSKKLATMIEAVVAGQAPGQQNWESELDYWLKRRSVQMLGLMKNSDFLEPVLNVLKSPTAGLWLRFDALEALGRLDLGSLPKPKVKEVALTVAEFMASSLQAESTSIQDKLDKLIYDNMLFQNVDLETEGTNWGADVELGSGGMGDEFGMDMGMDMEMEMGMGGGFQPGGVQTEIKIVELPTYQLNIIRRKIKALAFGGRTVLKNENRGVWAVADQETKNFIDNVTGELGKLLKESNVGIVNLDDQPAGGFEEEEPPTESVANQLAKICVDSANNLETTIADLKGEEAMDPLAAMTTPEKTAAPTTPVPTTTPAAPTATPRPASPPAGGEELDAPDFGS